MSFPRFQAPLFYWPSSDGSPLPNATLTFFDGDTNTLATTYADANGTQPNENPIASNGAGVWPAIFLSPSVSYKVKLLDENGGEQWTEFPVFGSGIFYEIACDFLGGTPPSSHETMAMHVFATAAAFPANFVGSYGFCLVNPAAAFTATIADAQGNAIGTMAIDTAGGFTFETQAGAAVSAAIGDTWIVKAPAIADATLADLAWTLLGVVSQ